MSEHEFVLSSKPERWECACWKRNEGGTVIGRKENPPERARCRYCGIYRDSLTDRPVAGRPNGGD